jgi:hypothetical protein
MMTAWKSESLAETIWALNRLLRLVREAGSPDLRSPAGDYRSQVEQWLRAVEPTLGEPREDGQLISAIPFPLKNSELDSLEEEIHRVLSERVEHSRGREQARAREAWKASISLNASLEHLHVTLQRAAQSSRFIIEGLGVLFLLDAVFLVLVSTPRTTFTTNLGVATALAVNLSALIVIAGLWWLHHSRLQQHREGLQWHGIHHGL